MQRWSNILGFCRVPLVLELCAWEHCVTPWFWRWTKGCGMWDAAPKQHLVPHSLVGTGPSHVSGLGLIQYCAHFQSPEWQILTNQTLPPANLLGESCGRPFGWAVHRSFSPAKQLSFILLYLNMWFRDDSSLLFEPGLRYYLAFQPNIIRNVDVSAQGHFLQN